MIPENLRPLPSIPCYDISGIVEQVLPGSSFQVGDEVCGILDFKLGGACAGAKPADFSVDLISKNMQFVRSSVLFESLSISLLKRFVFLLGSFLTQRRLLFHWLHIHLTKLWNLSRSKLANECLFMEVHLQLECGEYSLRKDKGSDIFVVFLILLADALSLRQREREK